MKIFIAGAGGFIGRNLTQFLTERGHEVTGSGRKDIKSGRIYDKIRECEIVINLAGYPVTGIWTRGKKRRIYDSRILTTREIVKVINEMGDRIKLIINISGVGIYDSSNIHDEDSIHFANNFLSRVILDWEKELKGIKKEGTRIAILRLGIVLGKDGGILNTVSKPFRWGLGYSVDSGFNFPFIHMEDLLRICLNVIENEAVSGVINVVSPEKHSIRDFFTMMMEIYHCRIKLVFGTSTLKILMGESSVLITEGQQVNPKALIEMGYVFKFPDLRKALIAIFGV